MDPHGYSDYFLCFAEDIDGDGWLDLVNVGFPGSQTAWYRNPGQAGGLWERHLAIEKTGNESPAWIDLDGDGKKELVFCAPDGVAYARPGADPSQLWPVQAIAAPDHPRPMGHGLGVGDVNGDGRLDVLCPQGWWEQPADRAVAHWPFHAGKLSDECAQMITATLPQVDRPVVFSTSAHRYGVWWAAQNGDGWELREIDKTVSQTHALCVADITGDGLPDLITGKRFWAHTQGDPGIDEPSLMVWYEMRMVDGQPDWVRHVIDHDSGVGLHFEVLDVNGDGLLDIVTSNKKGVHLFLQKRKVADG
ncbi:MAG: VCBS repeat-containing protein [Armatimonadetes bacterium]|nr:VCBS repeat-containing protein [Armatimonadota bacterium]